ncbi:MAG TPA: phosphoribosylanthranilate isomerase [Bryobacteraceae bacterium]|jgi:phosphoribosylanthranilate isomerase|nr:phosphoribosylanthranilate isomerase [Bryobacteraceae bacterium]
MFVKICGITNREDALAAVEAGAGALGFIFVPSSPRHVTPEQVEPWIKEVPAKVMKVGVFADETPEFVERIGSQLGLDVAQLHGCETPDRHPRGMRVWKAFRVKDAQVALADYPPDYPAAEAILIDGYDYAWSHTVHFTRPLILAGGLNENNVRDRIEQAGLTKSLWAVDVSSGIEASPGRKDHARMKKFIEAALRL